MKIPEWAKEFPVPDWVSPCGNAILYQRDCLEVLSDLPQKSIDSVVTDPPYIIGAISVGTSNSKNGTWADMLNAAFWFAEWFRLSKRLLRDSGHLSCCGNWRSIPTLICALAKAEWAATSCVIWDKQWIGPAYTNAFRPTYELAITAAMQQAAIANRSASDVFRGEKWLAGQCKTTSHPAEKPVDFMEYLVEHLSPHSGVVVDPFVGSGTTGVAALRLGRKFIGIEIERRYFDIACDRIANEHERFSLFNAASEAEVQRELPLAAMESAEHGAKNP